MKKIFCFGELLLRMSPEVDRRWIHEASIPSFLGGAELNVATALAKWNLPAKYVTALPDNYLAKEIMEELESKNMDASGIHLSGNRIGIYYMPQGADLKNASVIYDRNYPKKATASVVGIGGMAGGIGGVLVTKVGGYLFDKYKALGHIETGYTIMFTYCAVAYLLAWVIMKSLVPKYNPITDL